MKHNYVGDVGDFFKYGLLRALCQTDSEQSLKLGVVWYLFPDEEANADGLNLAYLNADKRSQYEPCDPSLYQALGQLIQDQDRRVEAIRERGILPISTVYFEEPLTFQDLAGPAARQAHRQQWHSRAKAAMADCDIVFVDPDNGLEIISTKIHQPKGPKYVGFQELTDYLTPEQTLVIYQHQQHKPILEQARSSARQLQAELGYDGVVYAMIAPNRIFFILPNDEHEPLLKKHLESLQDTPWKTHIQLVV